MGDREVHVGIGPNGTVKLEKRLANAPKLLKQIGILLVRDARQAFQDQKFGDKPWPEKYPGSRKPFISIAGVVQDFTEGEVKPKPETLMDRPALVRTTALRYSPAVQTVGEDEIELGSALPYATLQHAGGISTQPVTDAVKEGIEKWLGKTKNKKVFAPDFIAYEEFRKWAKAEGYGFKGNKGKKRNKTGNETVQEFINEQYRARLAFLLKPDFSELTTQVNARPFIGITADRADKIAELLADYISGTQGAAQP